VSWKRTLLLFCALVLLLTAGTWLVLRETGAGKAFVARLLERVIASPFELSDADVDLPGGTVTLVELLIAHPLDRSRALLKARDVRVSMDTNPLGSVGRVHRIVLRGLRIDDLQVAGSEAVAIEDIFRTAGGDTPGPPGTVPAIVIEDARVGLRFAADAPLLQFDDIDLELLPLAGDSEEMVLRGAMTTPLGTRVTVSGQGNPRAGRFRVLAKTGGIAVSADTLAPFSRAAADVVRTGELSGHIAAAQTWFEWPGDGTLRGGFQAEASALTLRLPWFPRRLDGAAKVIGSLQDDGTVHLEFKGDDERGAVHARAAVQRLFTAAPCADVALTVRGMRVDDELLAAAAASAVGARVRAAFAPGAEGEVDGEARIALRDGAVQVDADVELRGMSAAYHGLGDPPRPAFPYRVHDVAGRLRVRDRVLTVDRITARDARGGVIEVDGRVPLFGGGPRALTVRGRGIAFSPELRAALHELDPGAATHYDDCAPRGTADVVVEIGGTPSDTARDFAVRILPKGASAAYAAFPCRVDAIEGEVLIDRGGVVFDLRGRRGGAVAVRGRFPKGAAADEGPLRSELWVKAADLPLDEELHAAAEVLAPGAAELWPALSPTGRVAAEVSTWRRGEDEPFRYHLRVDVLDGTILPRAFPLPLVRLQGPIFVDGDGERSTVDVHLVRGVIEQPGHAPADVLIAGSARHDPVGTTIDITTVGRDVALRAELRDVLDQVGALSRASWDMLAPQGRVDVIARQQSAGDDDTLHTNLRMQLRDVAVHAEWLPAPVTELNGEIEAVDGRASAAELRGLLGLAPIVIRDGELTHGDDGSRVRGTITADEVPIDDGLARLFGNSRLRDAYLARKARGRAKVTALQLDCTVPDAPTERFRLTASGQFALRDCALEIAVGLEHVDGILAIHECRVDGDSGTIRGALANVSLQVLGQTLHDFGARFTADADNIAFDDLSFRFHGGRVVGAGSGPHLHYATAGEGTLSAEIAWQGVRLSDLAGGRSALSGNIDGRLSLARLPGTRLIDAQASGELHITAGRLGQVPVFRTIYGILRRQPQFTTADAEFRIGERSIAIDRLKLGSQIIDVYGRGSVAMDGYIDMEIELPDLFGDAADFLLLPQILHNAVAQVLQFKLHGYLRDPEVTPLTPFQRTPARRPIQPIPALLPELPRKRF